MQMLTKGTCVDENRQIVVDGNHIRAIMRHFLNPELIHVAIPVIYNICMDFGECLYPSFGPESHANGS